MKVNFTKTSIAFLLIIFISTLSFFIIESELNPTTIKDISVLTYSTFTLVIALLLFDRFDYRKKIFERKLEATLTLLSELKSTKIQIFYQDKINHITYGGSPFLLDKKQINIPFLKEHIDFKVKIVFETRNIFEYLEQINLHRANPFMPKEIVKSLDFLSIGHLKGITNDNEYLDKNIKIFINNKIQNNLKDQEWYKPSTQMEFGTFIMNYLNTLDSIENWINKHSNFKADLNL
ncbi:hypothetical protein [Flavobacterium franklandianum]|uniref:Uncharacterized protein n=1 Tax=Flavobacterium franklandianum TaxID=2594430 RepID=A0A553CU19_9FLAO|nr:hypothetical protein [Flavobacterium franklandianum]TRX24007.1 hypothetical protein FNW17_02190 [Flavobacterium franklandianum]